MEVGLILLVDTCFSVVNEASLSTKVVTFSLEEGRCHLKQWSKEMEDTWFSLTNICRRLCHSIDLSL